MVAFVVLLDKGAIELKRCGETTRSPVLRHPCCGVIKSGRALQSRLWGGKRLLEKVGFQPCIFVIDRSKQQGTPFRAAVRFAGAASAHNLGIVGGQFSAS